MGAATCVFVCVHVCACFREKKKRSQRKRDNKTKMERTAVHYMEIRTQKGAARARTRGHTTLNASWSLANLHSTEIRIARALSVTHAHAKVKTQKKRENPIDNIDRVSRFLMPHTSTSVPQARLLRSGGNENRKQNKSGFMSNFLFFFFLNTG